MSDDRPKRVRHENRSRGGGEYAQNLAEFDPETRLYTFEVESLTEAGLVVSDAR